MINAHKSSVGRPQRKRQLGRWEDNIKTEITEIVCESVDRIQLYQIDSIVGFCDYGNGTLLSVIGMVAKFLAHFRNPDHVVASFTPHSFQVNLDSMNTQYA
jgi:hypothetical protein